MKLFYIVTGTKKNVGCVGQHVHADNAAEAMKVANEGYDWPLVAYVYDVSQTALCPGRLDLDKCPREEFRT